MWNVRRIPVVALAAAVCISWLATELRSARAHEDPGHHRVLIALAVDGSAEAAYQLGRISEGTNTKIYWFETAAEKDHVGAMCALAETNEGFGFLSGLGHDVDWAEQMDRILPGRSRAAYWYERVLEIEFRKEHAYWEKARESVDMEHGYDLAHGYHPSRWWGSGDELISAGEIACTAVRMSRHMRGMEIPSRR